MALVGYPSACSAQDKAKLGLVVFKKRSGFGGKGYRFSGAEGRKKHDEVRKQMKAPRPPFLCNVLGRFNKNKKATMFEADSVGCGPFTPIRCRPVMGLMDELSDSSDDGVEDEHDVGGRAATRAAKERASVPQDTETVLKLAHNPKTMRTAMAKPRLWKGVA